MKLVWSGFGFVVPVVVGVALIAHVLLVPPQYRGDYDTFGMLAVAVSALVLPLGLLLNRRGREDHFMYLPVVAWGVLFLVGGLIPIAVVQGSRFWEGRAQAAQEATCAELAETMSACTSGGPSIAGMFQAMCEASAPEARSACLECVRAAADPCNPRGCEAACSFGPPR
ncbi:hypothetical protein [Sandaracinus amylolyticus]|uniref:hypothetical protein n=1 Tax=Sandaracinus amylolyticus TaxID=927083 RepID=UPI001F164A87|nr:hypothetical protein [Sandaracinus amylolyticus]UJR86669.1 Hypothetical protein I5071_87700 [Sandaracinus amylolyticus]